IASNFPSHLDAAIIDLVLPGLSCRELAEYARQRYPNIGLIYLAGYTDATSLFEGLAGHKNVLQTPFSADELLESLHEILDERGYAVALNDLRSPAETRAGIAKVGAEAIEFIGDISDEAVVLRFAAAVMEKFGRVDVLVNNAGISLIAPAEQTTAQALRRVLDVNLIAPFLLAKAFGAIMLRQRSGSVVN